MQRTIPVITVALLLVSAGCLGLAPDSSSTDGGTPTGDSTPTDAMPSADTPTPTDAPSSENSVEYVIERGGIPDEFGSVTLTMQVVFAENAEDFDRNACWSDTYYGPYKPTPTPIGKPSGDCHRTQQMSVDLTEIDDTHTLSGTAPGRFDEGHGLIVTDLTATYENGTSVTGIRGTGGHRASIQEQSDGQYRVAFSMESYQERIYDYWLVSELGDQ